MRLEFMYSYDIKTQANFGLHSDSKIEKKSKSFAPQDKLLIV